VDSESTTALARLKSFNSMLARAMAFASPEVRTAFDAYTEAHLAAYNLHHEMVMYGMNRGFNPEERRQLDTANQAAEDAGQAVGTAVRTELDLGPLVVGRPTRV